MLAGTMLLILNDTVNYLRAQNLLKEDGSFNVFTPEDDARLAVAVEQSLIAHGVNMPDKIDKIIKALPVLIDVLS